MYHPPLEVDQMMMNCVKSFLVNQCEDDVQFEGNCILQMQSELLDRIDPVDVLSNHIYGTS